MRQERNKGLHWEKAKTARRAGDLRLRGDGVNDFREELHVTGLVQTGRKWREPEKGRPQDTRWICLMTATKKLRKREEIKGWSTKILQWCKL